MGWGGTDWIDLVQNRDQWRAVVNTVINLLIPWNAGKFLSNHTRRFRFRVRLEGLDIFFLLLVWDFLYCGHYWPIVPAPDDR
jgi:hypothetical protein